MFDLVDAQARTGFNSRVTTATIKCYFDKNQHRTRNKLINKTALAMKCLRCSEVEDWAHIIKFKKNRKKQADLIRESYSRQRTRISDK